MRRFTQFIFQIAFFLGSTNAFVNSAHASGINDDDVLAVTEGTSTDPIKHLGIIEVKNTSSRDVLCTAQVTGIIIGHSSNGIELEASQESDAVVDFFLKAGRSQERSFDFTNAVKRMRARWGDDNAILTKIDRNSLTSECRDSSTGPTVTCDWRGATVKEFGWLECPDCLYRYCQCQPNGKWGNCGSSMPSGGACNWNNPDWSNPACNQGGSMPCDWNQPDWSNPTCSGN